MKSAPSGGPGDVTWAQDLNDPNPVWSSVTPVIELRGITKRFGPVEVLTDIDLSLRSGRVHSLAGENGAGKSTVVKILGGVHQPDDGLIFKDGEEITIHGAAEAQRHGIAVIHQHPALFPDL